MNRRVLLYDTVTVLAFALVVRLWLIHAYPAILGGDTVLRLANSDRIQLAYQLPLLQAVIYGASQLFEGPLAVRYLMAMIGAGASVACYWLATNFMTRAAALLTASFFASNPFLVELSIVPYQEVLMICGLLFAFHFFFRGSILLSSMTLGLACLTRYEAWAASPVLVFAFWREREFRAAELFKALVLFGWAPAAWMIYHTGISAPGTFVVEPPRTAYRLMRYVYLGWITVKNTPIPVLILAAAGLWTASKNRMFGDHRIQAMCGFLVLVVIAILFSAHGEAPDPERFVTAREASVWVAAVILAAGISLVNRSKAMLGLGVLGIALGLVQSHYVVRRDTSGPQIRIAYELARYLDTNLKPGETAVILTKPVPPELVQQYLNLAARHHGEEGLQNARRILATTETTPPDYQRTLVHSRLGKTRIRSLAGNVGGSVDVPSCIALAAVWSDYAASNRVEAGFHSSVLAGANVIHRIEAGPLSAAIYRPRGQSCFS